MVLLIAKPVTRFLSERESIEIILIIVIVNLKEIVSKTRVNKKNLPTLSSTYD